MTCRIFKPAWAWARANHRNGWTRGTDKGLSAPFPPRTVDRDAIDAGQGTQVGDRLHLRAHVQNQAMATSSAMGEVAGVAAFRGAMTPTNTSLFLSGLAKQ